MAKKSEKRIGAEELYAKEVYTMPLCTRNEEKRLLKAIRAGKKDARNKLVKANLRFAYDQAKRLHAMLNARQKVATSFLDLVQEANIALYDTIDHWEEGHGARFVTYAAWFIRSRIQRFLADKGFEIMRFPESWRERSAKLDKLKRLHFQRTGEKLSPEACMKALRYSKKVFRLIEAYDRVEAWSLDQPITPDTESTFGEMFSVEATPEEFVERKILKKNAHSYTECIISRLGSRERTIIQKRFNLDHDREQTLVEVGRMFGVSRERIRQLQNQALQDIRTLLSDEEKEELHTILHDLSTAEENTDAANVFAAH